MTSIESGFRNALAKFSSGLTPKEVEEFRFTTLEDVHKVVVTIQHQQARRKEMMNLTRIQSFVEAMKNFGEVIEVFLNLSEFVPFIWGPIKFLLQVSAFLLPCTHTDSIPWLGMALNTAKASTNVQMPPRLPYSGMVISFHDSFKHETSYGFRSRESCFSCVGRLLGKD